MKRIVAILALICVCQILSAAVEGDYEYSVVNGKVTITAYKGTATSVTIPNTISGMPVDNIGTHAFSNNNTASSVTIPSSVTQISNGAFMENNTITTISIPNSVTNIGNSAFYYCRNLATINVPTGLIRIEYGMFTGCSKLKEISIPYGVTSIGNAAFAYTGLTSITIPSSVEVIEGYAFAGCPITSINMSDRFIAEVALIGISGQVATDYLVRALANNDAFVTAVANKIKATSGNYGIATQSGLSTAIEPLATKTQITNAINEGRAAGIASVTTSPNTWSLFTSSQIQNMAIGDLVLTREVNGNFVLNYDIEQSNDLANWTVYSANTQIVKLPADKAFVRIKAKQ
jgi:hypothetical protein